MRKIRNKFAIRNECKIGSEGEIRSANLRFRILNFEFVSNFPHLRISNLFLLLVLFPLLVAAGSPREEAELGRQFSIEAQAKLRFIDDVEVAAYVTGIGQRIAGHLENRQFDYNFSVVRDGSINAFAVPGGYIYLYGGLLTAASNDDEVAGVLGHEIAHVHAHHLIRQQEKTQLLNYAALVGLLASVVNPALGAGAIAANQAAQLHYSREFEQEADYLGARYMKESGYDPRGMLDFFKKLMDQQEAASTVVPPYLLTHPLSKVRLTNLEAVLKQRQWDGGARRPATLELQRAQLIVRARSGSAKDLIDQYQRYADQNPKNGQVRYLLGLAYLETGAYNPAIETLDEARQMGFSQVDRDLGRAYLRQRDLPKAREFLSRAAEVEPDDALTQLNLAKVLEAMNETDAALRAYQQAVRLAPAVREAQYGLGMLSGRAGRQGEGFYHLAVASKLEGDYPKAVSQFDKAIPLLAGDATRADDAKKQVAELNQYIGRAFKLP
jgi:predicted Zn-dependent protease